ncbi:MAG TPA: FAD-binding oxidoreductase [Thermohalobaculum sp.]|nr:FAD-binding oxidoreductase [Thermohalobaculum sp.]
MSRAPIMRTPGQRSCDVVIVGGAMIGSACAWFLANDPDFNGRVLVVERDPALSRAASALSASCIRHQFSNAVNVAMSMFGTDYIRSFRERLGGDPEIPEITLNELGYLFLATEAGVPVLRASREVQAACGAATELLAPGEIAARFPFYNLDGIALGSFNPVGEGWFDGLTMLQWWRRKARERGVEYVRGEVSAISRRAGRIEGVTLASGESIACGTLVNAAGPNAGLVAALAGIALPVEPRKRCLFVFDCRTELGQPMPLTIDPSGVHCRSEGALYLAGAVPRADGPADPDDFEVEQAEFDEIIWPALAHRVPAFAAIRPVNAWAGHYDYNALDQNAVIGPHPEVANFVFANGFSGHGLQQAPAVGRAIAELIAHGGYRSLDLSGLGYARIAEGRPFLEKAII